MTREEFSYIQHLKHREKLIGKKINYYKVLAYSHAVKRSGNGYKKFYKCQCRCGKVFTCQASNRQKSCGCLKGKGKSGLGGCKLTFEQAEAARALYASGAGYSRKDIAAMYGVKPSVIYKLLSGKSYTRNPKDPLFPKKPKKRL
jgi:hypothetical protein